MNAHLYKFDKLKSCLKIVKEHHPNISDPIVDIAQDDLTALITKIINADIRELPAIANGLSNHEATVLVHAYQRQMKKSHYKKISSVLEVRPFSRQLIQAWSILKNHPQCDPLINAMKSISGSIEIPNSQKSSILGKLQSYWISDSIFKSIVSDIESSNNTLDIWTLNDWNSDNSPNKAFPIYHMIKASILSYGSRKLLKQHSDELSEWFEFVPETYYDSASKNYINQLRDSEWDWAVIENIVNRHGLPAAKDYYWEGIEEKKRLIIQRHIGGKLMDEFFSDMYDPDGRFGFWKSYVDYVAEIAFPDNKSRVMLVFAKAIVVEFRDTNNAAYFYYIRDKSWIKKRVVESYDNGQCKDRDRAITYKSHFPNWKSSWSGYLRQII
jgi:hypothetical protein